MYYAETNKRTLCISVQCVHNSIKSIDISTCTARRGADQLVSITTSPAQISPSVWPDGTLQVMQKADIFSFHT